jgi:Concanavalin A-like lectin/glucanases superfamily
MRVSSQVKILGLLLISGFICQVTGQSATFTDKLKKVSVKPTVALSFTDKKIITSGSAKAKLTSINGKPEFVKGINDAPALVISNQGIGVTGIDISGGKICSASSGSFVCFFTPLVKYEDIAKQRHYFFSENQKDSGIYTYMMGNSRLTLQFKNMVDNKYSWPSYACDFKWRKGSTERFEPGKWYHIAISWDNECVSIFINGVLRNKKTPFHKGSKDFKNIILGTYGKKSLNGAICDVAFFAKRISQKDIKMLSFR